jgi:hypothetical protein
MKLMLEVFCCQRQLFPGRSKGDESSYHKSTSTSYGSLTFAALEIMTLYSDIPSTSMEVNFFLAQVNIETNERWKIVRNAVQKSV